MATNRDQTLQEGKGEPPDQLIPESQVRELQAEQENLRRQLADLQEQHGQLCKERDNLERQRDDYLRSLRVVLAAQVPPMTPEELDDLKNNGISQEELLAEINRLFPAKPRGE